MPTQQIALLRGINVGRAKRVAMADLRALIEDLGHGNVRTLLNSGNVVFTTPRAAKGDAGRIEKALVAKCGVSARVIMVSAAELAAVVADNPLLKVATDPTRLLIAFLADPADRARLAGLLEQDWSAEALALGKRVAYIWSPEGVLASRALDAVVDALGDAVTVRNWATVLKLHALLEH